jgi:hypothetical protein
MKFHSLIGCSNFKELHIRYKSRMISNFHENLCAIQLAMLYIQKFTASRHFNTCYLKSRNYRK